MIESAYTPDFPAVGNDEVPCCMGSAVYGHERCTCWTPVYTTNRIPEPQSGPSEQRKRMCGDCAFRKGSPERSGDPEYAHSDEGELDALVGEAFFCHRGMRQLLRCEHPSGAVLKVVGHYESLNYRPCKQDGSPAEYCAGWARARRKLERMEGTTP